MSNYACSCAICRATLATPVDEILPEATFIPLMIPCEDLVVVDPVRPSGGLLEAVQRAAQEELGNVETPTAETLMQGIAIAARDAAHPRTRELVQHLSLDLRKRAESLVGELSAEAKRAAVEKLPASSILKAPNTAVAMQRLANGLRNRLGLFKPEPAVTVEKQRTAKSLCPFEDIGLLFLERLRSRPLGHTVERAPFHLLSVEPGETIALTHESFSQRDVSQEDIFNEEQSFERSLTSTLSSNLSSEYNSELSKVTNWKIAMSAEVTIPIKTVPLKISSTKEYGSTTTSRSTYRESVSRAKTLTETSSSKLTRSHRTTVRISKTENEKATSSRTFTNSSGRVKKIYMRKLMRVTHMSYERYGVRLAWSPCIENPGRDVKDLIPGMAAFPKQIQAIRDKWNNTAPPTDLGSPPETQTVYSPWSGQISGGAFGMSKDQEHSVEIPSGYVYSSAYVEKSEVQGDPGVSIKSQPNAGSTGVVTVKVHIGLDGGFKPDKVSYRACIVATPGPTMMAQWNTKVQEWRDSKAQEEIAAFLATKQEELKGLDLNAWPPSELMRRVISTFFGDPEDYHTCQMVEMLHRVFEWERLSYELFAPWWNPETKVDGLQSLATTFFNASWAKLYIPMRPGYEEEAIAFLASVNALPQQQALLADIEYYLQDMRQNVEPLFQRIYVPGATDPPEVDGPCDILLTTLGDDKWGKSYESQLNFQVLDRWVVTTPTDGVDYEESYVRCALEDAPDAMPPHISAGLGTGSVGGNIIVAFHNPGTTAANVRITGIGPITAPAPNVIVWNQGVVGAPELVLPWILGSLAAGGSISRNLGFKATAGDVNVPFEFQLLYSIDDGPPIRQLIKVAR